MDKQVIIFHSPLAADAPADELDVLDEAGYFKSGLSQLGFIPHIFPFPYDISAIAGLLQEIQPVFVVNLVETIFADGKLVHIGPFFFEHFQVPYTGCSAHSIYLSSHKILSKQHMQVHGIPTPAFYNFNSLLMAGEEEINAPFLVKSLWEHASFGLDEDKPLLFSTRQQLIDRFKQEKNPAHFFCEQYIHGREFNLSVIDGPQGPTVLPPAEIRFEYPEGKPRILGYKAKWAEESFEYKNTIRTFDFDEKDRNLIKELESIALKCWHVFELGGFARVDFRVDANENIYVLEINANPCISPDSGFVAAAHRAGLTDAEVIEKIIAQFKQD